MSQAAKSGPEIKGERTQLRFTYTMTKIFLYNQTKMEPQWLKHLWDSGNLFETWVVRTTEG